MRASSRRRWAASCCAERWPCAQTGALNSSKTLQVMLRVTDLDASIKYYTEALGCKLLRKKDNPEYKYTLAFLGYGPEDESTVFELTYNWCARRPALQRFCAQWPARTREICCKANQSLYAHTTLVST